MLQDLRDSLAIDPEMTGCPTLTHTINMARTPYPAVQLHRIHLTALSSFASGKKWRNFTPRRTDHPTDSVVQFASGIHIALVHPDCPNLIPPVYTCGYSDQLDCIDWNGSVPVPDGPGLGVSYDWEFINKRAVARHIVEA